MNRRKWKILEDDFIYYTGTIEDETAYFCCKKIVRLKSHGSVMCVCRQKNGHYMILIRAAQLQVFCESVSRHQIVVTSRLFTTIKGQNLFEVQVYFFFLKHSHDRTGKNEDYLLFT